MFAINLITRKARQTGLYSLAKGKACFFRHLRQLTIMNLSELRQYKDRILSAAKANRAGNVRIFGSVVRGDTHYASDVDFLVTLDPEASLLDLGGLLEDLKDILRCPVDVVADDCIHPYIRDAVLKEATPL